MTDLLVVAEVGLNHDGNFDLAYELIRQAKMAGADIAKFQFGWRCKPGEINQIDEQRARQLKSWCEELGIELMASLITEEGLVLNNMMPDTGALGGYTPLGTASSEGISLMLRGMVRAYAVRR